MTNLDGVVLHIHGPSTAVDQVDTVSDLYADAFFPPPHNQGPTELARMVDAWPRRLATPGFRLVVAEHEGQPIGCAYGHQLLPDSRWWEGALEPIPDEVTAERKGRTLAVIDMMVTESWRRRHVAEALHMHLLAGRAEERATLLVDPINDAARRAYRKWGYITVGQIQPFHDSPRFDAMVKRLASI